MSETKRQITVIPGDGIGPEVCAATQRMAEAAGAEVEWDIQEAGKKSFERGLATGVPAETIASIKRTGVVLKGPLATPVGHGGKSANVTLRKMFEMYANVRPVRELPGIVTPFHGRKIDMVVVRENVEDLYAGIEHMATPGVAQALKLVSDKGCEKACRFAFEVARSQGRKKVHCATKANILKLTEGLMKRTFERVAEDYPDVEAEHIIVDNCAYQLVRSPESFEVLVTTNMNGDILSDLTSGLVGGLGIAASSNIGNSVSMFEAVHGSAPDIAGQDKANPTALALSAVMMLRHISEFDAANRLEAALFYTLERQLFTADLAKFSEAKGTKEFTELVIEHIGKEPTHWEPRSYKPIALPNVDSRPDTVQVETRATIGIDVFIEEATSPEELGHSLEELSTSTALKLKMISNRGQRVYPPMGALTDNVDHWRCRFVGRQHGHDLSDDEIYAVLLKISRKHRWMHIEKLYHFEGERAYTLAQGEE